MPFDSNGVFSRVMNWTSDQQNGIAIECGRHDAEDDNFAEGFNETFCRDGRAAATGDFNLGQHKIQNLASGTATTDAVNKGQLDTGLSAKANTTDVVNLTGTQTITGTKTFQGTGWNLYIQNTNVTYNKAPSSDTATGITFIDKDTQYIGTIACWRLTDNSTTMQFNIYGRNGSWATRPLEFKILSNGKEAAFAPASDIIDSIVTTTAIRKTSQSGDNASWAVKFGNGFIIQGGLIESNIYTVTLAIPFTKASYQVSMVQADDSEHNINPTLSDKTVTNFKCGHHGWRVSWIAAGF